MTDNDPRWPWWCQPNAEEPPSVEPGASDGEGFNRGACAPGPASRPALPPLFGSDTVR